MMGRDMSSRNNMVGRDMSFMNMMGRDTSSRNNMMRQGLDNKMGHDMSSRNNLMGRDTYSNQMLSSNTMGLDMNRMAPANTMSQRMQIETMPSQLFNRFF